MELQEFREQFIDTLRFDAEHDGSEPEAQFISKVLETLEDMGEVCDPNPISFEIRGRRGRIMAFDAYAYDEADSSLVLISSEFSNNRDTAPVLTNTRINEIVTRMENFLDESVNGHMEEYCDDSDEAIIISKEFRQKIGKTIQTSDILRFRFVIITDNLLSKQVKSITREDYLNRPTEVQLWTIDRIFQSITSNSSEIIEFDTTEFNCDGVQFLKAEIGPDCEYDAYLGIIPGRLLAKMYLKWGSKLLQGNVRAFLSARGKVNKGIRDTIINAPYNFFTYNNGIAIVARSVGFSEDGSRIVHFKDPQIINGGQTTASLANAIIKKEDKKGMDNLFVPMKLTVLNIEDELSEEQIDQYNSITKTISQCANSQNAVSEADFFSNHPFHVMMERLSEKVLAPPVGGNPFQTTWFYERSRGKWEQPQMQLSPAERRKYCEKHPKAQVIKKEKLAKCYNSILMNPHQVCQSSAINFSKFASYIEELYQTSRDSINDEFFKKCVCSVILFDSLDKMVGKASWYPKGGNKAQIVPYTISKLFSILPKNSDIDWHSIWQKQALYPALADELMKIAYIAHNFLMTEANGGIVRTISRTPALWTKFKNLSVTLSDKFLNSLISLEETKVKEAAAKRAHKFNSDIDVAVEIFKLGYEYWFEVYSDLQANGMLAYGDLSFIKSIAEYIRKGNLLTNAQCKRLIKIINKAEDKGYIMPRFKYMTKI